MLNRFSKKESDLARDKTGRIATIYLVVILVISAFLWGMHIGSKGNTGKTDSASSTYEISGTDEVRSKSEINFGQFWDMWEVINDRYVNQPVDEQDMFYGAMAGVVASLGDPY